MKKTLFIYFLFLHILIVGLFFKSAIFQFLGYQTLNEELTPHYYKMLSFYQRVNSNIPIGSVIFIGDSLTQGLAVSAVAPKSINFGIGYDTTEGVLHRIPTYTSIQHSKAVVLAIGLNDLKRRTNNDIINRYKKITALIPKHIPIIINAIHPVNESASGKIGINKRITLLNQQLLSLSKPIERLNFLDISSLLTDNSGNLLNKFHIGDGIHLNGAGNEIWITNLKTIITPIIK